MTSTPIDLLIASHIELWAIIIEYVVQVKGDYLSLLLSCQHIKEAVRLTEYYQCWNAVNYMNKKSERCLSLPSVHFLKSELARSVLQEELGHAMNFCYPYLFERLCTYEGDVGDQYLELMKYFRWNAKLAQDSIYPQVASLASDTILVIGLLRRLLKEPDLITNVIDLLKRCPDYYRTAECSISIAAACANVLREKVLLYPELVFAAIEGDCSIIRFSHHISNNEDYMLHALKFNCRAITFSGRLTDTEFLIKAVRTCPRLLLTSMQCGESDKATVLAMVKGRPDILQYFPNYQSDPDALIASKQIQTELMY